MSEIKDERTAEQKRAELAAEGLLEQEIPDCPDCNSAQDGIVDHKEGQYVCKNCGTIVGNRIISDETEWRTFENDSGTNKGDPDRVGGAENPLLADLGLSTMIADDRNSGLSRAHNRTTVSREQRTLLNAFKQISTFASKLSLGQSIIERAQLLFKQVLDNKDIKTRKIDAVIATCIFVACRQAKVPRTIKEMCAATDVASRDLTRCFTKMKQLKLYKAVNQGLAPDAASLMTRYCSNLKLSNQVEKAAIHIATRIQQIGLAEGKTPSTIAGAAIFMAVCLTDKPRSLIDIGHIVGMAPTTIRTCYQTIYPRRADLVPADFATPQAVKALKQDRVG